MILAAVCGLDVQHMGACYNLLQYAALMSNEHGIAAKTL